MIKIFNLPDLGEGLTESEVLEWKVNSGDAVTLNQVIAEVETAKAVVELPSPFTGKIAVLHAEPGTVVAVGQPLVSFELEGAQTGEAGGATEAKREANLVGYGAMPDAGGRPSRRARLAAVPATVSEAGKTGSDVAVGHRRAAGESPGGDPASAVEPGQLRPRSTPPVRKLARDLGVDLQLLEGTGERGLITREDVQQAADGNSSPAPAAVVHSTESGAHSTAPGAHAADSGAQSEGAEKGAREFRTPIRGVRKHTAAAMVHSARTAPQVSEFLSIDVTETMELISRLRARKDLGGLKFTPLTLTAKAVLVALAKHRDLNSRWDEEAQEIVHFNYVNLGIAAATPRGLTVPNIKDAQSLSLAELSNALSELTATARAGKSAPAQLSGGTFSITNIGVFGIDAGTPMLNPGEAAILAMGAVREQPWAYRGEVALRQVMTLSLTFDHRLVDGEQGSAFLAELGRVLQDPGMLFTLI